MVNVIFDLCDSEGVPVYSILRITPDLTPYVYSASIVTNDTLTYSAHGTAITASLLPSTYRVGLLGTNTSTDFGIYLPNSLADGTTVNAKDYIINYVPSGSFNVISASVAQFAVTASYALSNAGTISSASFATTASLAFNATTASYAVTSSYAPVDAAFSASVAANKQDKLVTGNSYPVTSSWAVNAVTASVANSISFTPATASYANYARTSFVEDINYGLVVYLPFNEGSGSIVHNYSQYGVDATKYEVSNGATASIATGSGWNTNSKRGGYSQLLTGGVSGSASWVEMNNATIAAGLPSMSFAIWYQSSGSNVGATTVGRFVTKFNSGTSGEFSYQLNNANSISVILVNASAQRLDQTVTTPQLNDNKWHHVAGTYDGFSSSVYVDGKLCGAVAFTGSLQNSPYKLRVGTFENIGLAPLTGYVDEFKLWGRALTANEVAYLYNEGNLENAIYTDASGNRTVSGNVTFANTITGSVSGTSSYAITASYALNGGGSGLTTGSTYPITSSWANNAITASYALSNAGTVSSASYALNAANALTANTASYVSSSATVTIQSGNNTTELRNSASAQRFDIYGAFTTTASFGRLSFYQSGNDMVIDNNPQGTATGSGDLLIKHSANHSVKIFTNGTQRWTFGSNGDFLPAASTYNIGQGGQGVNNLYVNNIFGSTVSASVVTASTWQAGNNTFITSNGVAQGLTINSSLEIQGGIYDGANAVVAATFDDQHTLYDNGGNPMVDFTGINSGTLYGNWQMSGGAITGSITTASYAIRAATASYFSGSITNALTANTASYLSGSAIGASASFAVVNASQIINTGDATHYGAIRFYDAANGVYYSFAAQDGGLITTNDVALANVSIGGNLTMGDFIDMGSNSVQNLIDPVSSQDAATKNYVDTHTASWATHALTASIAFQAPSTVKSITGSAYTLTTGDVGYYLRMLSGSVVTVPTGSFAQGCEILLEQAGSGQVTVAAGSGVTLRSSNSFTSSAQYAVLGLKQVDSASVTWILTGDRA